ncbi:unnamed protein product, partial [Urochloa humidicola]
MRGRLRGQVLAEGHGNGGRAPLTPPVCHRRVETMPAAGRTPDRMPLSWSRRQLRASPPGGQCLDLRCAKPGQRAPGGCRPRTGGSGRRR